MFQGRLTLKSACPVMAEDVVSSTVYYAPYDGCAVHTGGADRTFTGGPTDQVGLSLDISGHSAGVYDVFAGWDGSSAFLFTGPAWNALAETIIAPVTTITDGTGARGWVRPDAPFNGTTSQACSASARIMGSPASNDGMNNCLGQNFGAPHYISKVKLYQPNDDYLRGNAPSALPVSILGYNEDAGAWDNIGVASVDASTIPAPNPATLFTLYATCMRPYSKVVVCIEGNTVSAINIGQLQFYEWTQSRTADLTRYNGIAVNAASMTGRKGPSTTFTCDQYAGTHLGTIQVDTGGTCSAHVSQGGRRKWGVWNRYNQAPIILKAGVDGLGIYEPSATMPVWAPVHNNADNCLMFVSGEPQQVEAALLTTRGVLAGGNSSHSSGHYQCAIGINRTDAPDGQYSALTFELGALPTSILNSMSDTSPLVSQPLMGANTLYAIENHRYDTTLVYGGNIQTMLWARFMG